MGLRSRYIVAFFAAFVLSSCSDDAPTPSPELSEAHASLAVALLDQARAASASDDQIAVIEEVALTGRDLTYEEYTAAVNAAIECSAAAGLWIDEPTQSQYHGQPMLDYGFAPPDGMTGEQAMELNRSCYLVHARFVDHLYQTQPATSLFLERVIAEYRPAMVKCFADAGFPVADDSGIHEWAQADQLVVGAHGEDASCYMTTGFNAALSG